jgi:general secretion pathway protein H
MGVRASETRPAGPKRQRSDVPHRRTHASFRQHGVSLLEMLLVIALIAATSVLAAGALGGGFAGMQLRSSAKQIASQLRYTRTQAIATGEPQRFVIDPAAHTWRAPNGRDGDVPEALGIRFYGARQVQPSRGEGAIVFFPDGASTGGRVQLSRERAAWNVDVAWLTGQVRLRRAEADQ